MEALGISLGTALGAGVGLQALHVTGQSAWSFLPSHFLAVTFVPPSLAQVHQYFVPKPMTHLSVLSLQPEDGDPLGNSVGIALKKALGINDGT